MSSISKIEFREKTIRKTLLFSSIVFFISIICIICFNKNKGLFYLSNDKLLKLYIDTLYYLVVNSFILIIISIILKKKKTWIFTEWSQVFFERYNSDEKNKITTILFSVYLPVLTFVFFKIILYNFDGNSVSTIYSLSIFNFFGIWLTFLSFIVAVKIYFEVQKNKTKTLKEYLEIAIQALEKMNTNETLVFIAPTLFVGAIENETQSLSRRFRETLIRKAEKLENGGEIKISILNANLKDSFPYNDEIESQDKAHNNFNNYVSYPYFKYHKYFNDLAFKNKNSDEPDSNWFYEHFNFLKELYDNTKIMINELKDDKSTLYDFDNSKNAGFFCIANFDSGFLYFGEYVVEKINFVPFYGSWIKDQNVMNIQKDMLLNLIEENKI